MAHCPASPYQSTMNNWIHQEMIQSCMVSGQSHRKQVQHMLADIGEEACKDTYNRKASTTTPKAPTLSCTADQRYRMQVLNKLVGICEVLKMDKAQTRRRTGT